MVRLNSKKYLTALWVVLLALAGVNLSLMAYRYLGMPNTPLPALDSGSASRPEFASMALFSEGTAQPADSSVEELDVAKTPHKVLGIVGSDRGRAAIIQSEQGETKVYRVGNAVSPGVHIEQILPLNVVVSRGGVRRRLPLSREPMPSTARPQVSANAASEPNSAVSQLVRSLSVVTGPNDKKVLKVLSVPPALAGLDIQQDDLILKVNESDVFTLYDDPVGFSSLLGVSSLTLTLERGGQPHAMSIDSGDFFRLLNSQ